MTIFFIISYIKNIARTNVKIEYRYIPRTFKEEQEEPVYASDIYSNMFEGDYNNVYK